MRNSRNVRSSVDRVELWDVGMIQGLSLWENCSRLRGLSWKIGHLIRQAGTNLADLLLEA